MRSFKFLLASAVLAGLDRLTPVHSLPEPSRTQTVPVSSSNVHTSSSNIDASSSSVGHASSSTTSSHLSSALLPKHSQGGASPKAAATCFPSVGFVMPAATPSSLTNWWCDKGTEYAFLGFSYEVTNCQSLTQLRREFLDIRNQFSGRYVRLYGFCDRAGFYNDIVDAAWGAGLGVHALIWFGFDGDNLWKTRRDTLFSLLKSNPKAKFVTRVVQFGSEPLYDWVLDADDLAVQITAAKATLSSLSIPVTISELAYGYQSQGGAQSVLNAIDLIDVHILPFFSQTASTANKSWTDVTNDLNWFITRSQGKKIYMSQNGWPSETYPGVEPNSPDAVANIQNEKDYSVLLDNHCSDFKTMGTGGIGWFWHIYSDDQEPGYGLYNYDGVLKFPFKPKTSC